MSEFGEPPPAMNPGEPAAIVTGAGAGIGLAYARLLHTLGHPLAMLDLDPGVVDRAKDLGQDGAPVIGVRLDVAEPAEINRAVAAIARDQFMAVNLRAPFLLAHSPLSYVIKACCGSRQHQLNQRIRRRPITPARCRLERRGERADQGARSRGRRCRSHGQRGDAGTYLVRRRGEGLPGRAGRAFGTGTGDPANSATTGPGRRGRRSDFRCGRVHDRPDDRSGRWTRVPVMTVNVSQSQTR